MTNRAKGLDYWASLIGRKPHASVFVRNDDGDKRTVERGVVEEWCRSMEQEFQISIAEVARPPIDPPDFHVRVNGVQCAVELAELVDEKAIRQAIRAEKGRGDPPGFEQLQWTHLRFEAEIRSLVDHKQRKYENRMTIDALVIHSAEPWLRAAQVREWGPTLEFEVPPSIARAYLLLNYAPELDQEHWPVIQLFGERL